MALRRIRGTAANDLLDGTIGRPNDAFVLRGLEGNDSLLGGALADRVRGDDGDDTLFGDAGADTLRGGVGDDVLFGPGDGSRDLLLGRDGDDRFVIGGSIFTGAFGFGRDVLRGGDGFDTLVVRLDNNYTRGFATRIATDIATLEAWIASSPPPDAAIRLKTLGVQVAGIEAVELVREPSVVTKPAIEAGKGGFWIRGEAADSNAGYAVAALGDVNGDGLADLLIGAPHRSTTGGQALAAGASYVVFGRTATTPIDLAQVAAGIGGYKLSAGGAGDRVGTAVAGIGDVNGDGRPDLLIGAPGFDPGTEPPAAYVVYGRADGTPVDLSALGPDEGYTLLGRGDSQRFDPAGEGSAVAALGDVDGDGIPDFAVASWFGAFQGSAEAGGGAVTVVFGGFDGDGVDLFAVPAAGGGFRVELELPIAGPPSIAGVGDVNGDGLADLLVGVPRVRRDVNDFSGAGAAYLVLGKADGGTVDLADVAAGIGGVKILGEPGSSFGGGIRAVGGAGDVNGDGIPDLIIGTPFSSEAFVVFGRRSFDAPIDLVDVAAGTGGFRIYNDTSQAVGNRVGAAGDVNGDGFDDLLVGLGGGAVIVFGKPDGRGVRVGFGPNGEGFEGIGVLTGFTPNPITGGVTAAGDVNGDGFDDLLLGAPSLDRDGGVFGADQAGGAYVVFGRADWMI